MRQILTSFSLAHARRLVRVFLVLSEFTFKIINNKFRFLPVTALLF